jgi:hypothetical protein
LKWVASIETVDAQSVTSMKEDSNGDGRNQTVDAKQIPPPVFQPPTEPFQGKKANRKRTEGSKETLHHHKS